MRKLLTLLLFGSVFAASSAFAADPIVGTWTLNLAKSKLTSMAAPKSITRVYTESNGVYTLEQTTTASDGKEIPFKVQYSEGKEETVTGQHGIDSIHATKKNDHTWDFALKAGGKEVGHVHRTVSADGKVLTVHNTGMQPSGATGDDTLVFDKK